MKECSVSSKDASSIIGGGAGKVEDVEKKTIKSCLSGGDASELKCMDTSSIIGHEVGKVEDVAKKTIKSCLSVGTTSEMKCPLENSIKVNFNLQDDLDTEVDEDAMMPLNMSQMSEDEFLHYQLQLLEENERKMKAKNEAGIDTDEEQEVTELQEMYRAACASSPRPVTESRPCTVPVTGIFILIA